jgi:hypothetical protein
MVDDKFYGSELPRPTTRIANQITQACGWKQVPRYLIRNRDGAYREVFIRRVHPWAYVIDRRRRARHGKTHMLNG